VTTHRAGRLRVGKTGAVVSDHKIFLLRTSDSR
jgi:hypothetical protein